MVKHGARSKPLNYETIRPQALVVLHGKLHDAGLDDNQSVDLLVRFKNDLPNVIRVPLHTV